MSIIEHQTKPYGLHAEEEEEEEKNTERTRIQSLNPHLVLGFTAEN